MITVASLKKILGLLSDSAQIYAYEGEGTGLVVKDVDSNRWAFINARDNDIEDEQDELALIALDDG